jgi:hypothetical protein
MKIGQNAADFVIFPCHDSAHPQMVAAVANEKTKVACFVLQT